MLLKTLLCGVGSFNKEEDHEPCSISSSTPKRSSSSKSSKKSNKNDKNPYSRTGLDKFAIVVASLEKKRKKIYKQMGSQKSDLLVRFSHSSKGLVPVVIELTDQQENNKCSAYLEALEKSNTKQSPEHDSKQDKPDKTDKNKNNNNNKNKNEKKFLSIVDWARWRRHYYFPVLMVLILLCIVMYGRSFAILCTTLWWYFVPTMKHEESNSGPSLKKRVCMKWPSEKNMKSSGIKPSNGKMLQHGSSFPR